MKILSRDKLPVLKAAGQRSYRLVGETPVADRIHPGEAWSGIGALVSLVDTTIASEASTQRLPADGGILLRLLLQGGLRQPGDGCADPALEAWQMRILSTGGADVPALTNVGATPARLVEIQLSTACESPLCRDLRPAEGRVTRVYGAGAALEVAADGTCVDVARLHAGQSLDIDKTALVYVGVGRGFANEEAVGEGTLVRAGQLTFDATHDSCLLIVHERDACA